MVRQGVDVVRLLHLATDEVRLLRPAVVVIIVVMPHATVDQMVPTLALHQLELRGKHR